MLKLWFQRYRSPFNNFKFPQCELRHLKNKTTTNISTQSVEIKEYTYILWPICSRQDLWSQRNSRCLVTLARNNRLIVKIRDLTRTAVAMERFGKHLSAETNSSNSKRLCFLVGPYQGVIKRTKKIVWVSRVPEFQVAVSRELGSAREAEKMALWVQVWSVNLESWTLQGRLR
jgi:hypothetical protein